MEVMSGVFGKMRGGDQSEFDTELSGEVFAKLIEEQIHSAISEQSLTPSAQSLYSETKCIEKHQPFDYVRTDWSRVLVLQNLHLDAAHNQGDLHSKRKLIIVKAARNNATFDILNIQRANATFVGEKRMCGGLQSARVPNAVKMAGAAGSGAEQRVKLSEYYDLAVSENGVLAEFFSSGDGSERLSEPVLRSAYALAADSVNNVSLYNPE